MPRLVSLRWLRQAAAGGPRTQARRSVLGSSPRACSFSVTAALRSGDKYPDRPLSTTLGGSGATL
jgi:hypothetical protein